MRIAIYKDTLANGRGADDAVIALAAGLRERGHDAVLFEKGDFAMRIVERWDVVVSAGTNELLDLHGRFRRASVFPWPVVQQFHTNPKSQFKWKRFARNWRIRRALRRVAAIQVLREAFVPQVSKCGAPVEVIGNWSRFGDLAAKSAKSTNDVIVYPAAFSKGKNQKLLIRAFARVSPGFPGWRLRLLGRTEGRYADECRLVAGRLGIGGMVDFPGYSRDMAGEYGRCAFVAFPSKDEGFPLTLADAAAFGRPAVMVHDWIGCAAAGGGVLARPTVAGYADGMRRLMADPALRDRMGESARSFCMESYSRGKILDAWERLLNSVAGKGGMQR